MNRGTYIVIKMNEQTERKKEINKMTNNPFQKTANASKRFTGKVKLFFSVHKWMILVFFLVLFRAPLMKAVQNHIIQIKKQSRHHCETGRSITNQSNNQSSKMIASLSGVYLTEDDSDDDGCGDDEGCDTEEDNEYYGTESSSEGCSDDDGCYEETDNSDYNQSGESADGCSCDGEAVVGSSGGYPQSFYNSELIIQLNLSQSNRIDIKITDMNDYPKSVIQSEILLTAGNYTYRWNGRDQYTTITTGTYRAVLSLNGPLISYASRAFTYNLEHGFQINGTENNFIVFSY